MEFLDEGGVGQSFCFLVGVLGWVAYAWRRGESICTGGPFQMGPHIYAMLTLSDKMRHLMLAVGMFCGTSLTGWAAFPAVYVKAVVTRQFHSPTTITHAGDGSGRVFVCDQPGRIWIVQGGQMLPVPFLDIRDRAVGQSTGYSERGLLGLAFHPGYGDAGSVGFGRYPIRAFICNAPFIYCSFRVKKSSRSQRVRRICAIVHPAITRSFAHKAHQVGFHALMQVPHFVIRNFVNTLPEFRIIVML